MRLSCEPGWDLLKILIKGVSVTQKSNNVSFAIVRDCQGCRVFWIKSVFFGGEWNRGVGASRSSATLVGYFCVIVFRP